MSWLEQLRWARDVNARQASARFDLDDICGIWRDRIPYHWDGDEHQVLDIVGCMERGYGCCADAAAHLLGACKTQGLDGVLCIEKIPLRDFPNYHHVRVIVEPVWYDPYSKYRPAGLPEFCSKRVRI